MPPKRQKIASIGSSCPHLDALTQPKRKKLLDTIWSAVTQNTPLQNPERPFQCVTCSRQSADAAEHKAAHPGKKVPAGHELTLDLNNGEIFCTVCNDFVYCSEIDRAVTAMHAAKNDIIPGGKSTEEEPAPMPSPNPMGSPPGAVAIALAAAAATVTVPDVAMVEKDESGPSSLTAAADLSCVPLPRQADEFPAGLRGLNNMGHTCFMNSILQAFLHTPLLLEHHLAHGHSCGTCLDGTTFSSMHVDAQDPCLACELDRVFSEAYSGERTPLSPASFLHAWWSMAGGDLGGGCKQQDAHEFFLFMLQMISSVNGSTGIDNEGILTKLFDGSIRSDVVCCACCASSSTVDSFTNLSLDIPPPSKLLPPPIVPRPKAQATSGKAGGAAAAAKAGKQLVGAAKAAHLAKLSRQNSGKGVASSLVLQPEPTPELSSQFVVDLTGDESMASELTSGGGGGGAANHNATPTSQMKNKNMFNNNGGGGVLPRVSPPTDGMNALQPEQGSGINALGATVLGDGDAPTEDTLSSPQRRAAARGTPAGGAGKDGSLPPRSSSSPSADGIDPQQIQAAAAVAAVAAGPGALAHPALAQYLHWPGDSLSGCLRRFVWPEHLGASGHRWRCSECGSQDGAIKQLSIARLPPILVLHAKRFEFGGGTRATAKKLDTYLSFPLEDLDMAPYLTAEALKSRHVARPTPPTTSAAAGAGKGEAVVAPVATMLMTTPAPTVAVAAGGGGSRGRSRPASAAGGDSIRRTRSAATAAAAGGVNKSTGGIGIGSGGGGGGGCTRSTAMTRSASAAAAIMGIDGIDSDAPRFMPSPSSTALPSTTQNNNTINNHTDKSVASTSTSMYDLFAVVCHRGTFQGGHYVSYVRASDGQWYLCDDAYVQRVSEEVVRTSQAYMLFYGQKGLLPWNSTSRATRR